MGVGGKTAERDQHAGRTLGLVQLVGHDSADLLHFLRAQTDQCHFGVEVICLPPGVFVGQVAARALNNKIDASRYDQLRHAVAPGDLEALRAAGVKAA